MGLGGVEGGVEGGGPSRPRSCSTENLSGSRISHPTAFRPQVSDQALTALWLYNSLPAAVVSTAGALVAAGLYFLEILPGLDYWEP